MADFKVDPAEHIGLAHAAAQAYASHRHYEDAVSIATVAIVRAAKKYDPDRGRFSTLAMMYARRDIWNDFRKRTCKGRDERRTVHLSDVVIKRTSAYTPDDRLEQQSEINLNRDRVATVLAVLPDDDRDVLTEWMNTRTPAGRDLSLRKMKIMDKVRASIKTEDDIDRLSRERAGAIPRTIADAYTDEERLQNQIEDSIVDFVTDNPWTTAGVISAGMSRVGIGPRIDSTRVRFVADDLVDRRVLVRKDGSSFRKNTYAVRGQS